MENKPRSIKQLLQLLIDNKSFFREGLCYLVRSVYREGKITNFERFLLSEFISEFMPPKEREFIFDFKCQKGNGLFYFASGSWEPREEWLKDKISNYVLMNTWEPNAKLSDALQLMYDEIDKLDSGLCALNISLFRDYPKTYHKVRVHFQKSFPFGENKYNYSGLISTHEIGLYYFPYGDKQSRKKWLSHEILSLKSQNL